MSRVIRTYSPQQARALRNKIMAERIQPHCERQFERFPALESAILFVAQYWDDEAEDAVHCQISYSISTQPELAPYLARRRKQEVALEEHYDSQQQQAHWREYWLVEGEPALELLGLRAEKAERIGGNASLSRPHRWDANGRCIPAFAAFTREGGHQQAYFDDAYSAYAILRPVRAHDSTVQGVEISTELIGTMHRPWLDGVAGEWSTP